MKRRTKSMVLSLLLGLSCNTIAQESQGWLVSAINNPARPAPERARDINRKPLETLQFFGMQPDMRVVELMPGGGWYSSILSAALTPQGAFFVALGTDRLPKTAAYAVTGAMSKMQKQPGPGFIFDFEEVDIGQKDLDMVLTFRNMHNFTPAARVRLNEAVFKALKPGGVYGVIDHTKRHMEDSADQTWRRLDPVMVIKEAQLAGFVLEDYSTLHARPEDALRYDTRHDSLVNESDRFTLKFRKPGN